MAIYETRFKFVNYSTVPSLATLPHLHKEVEIIYVFEGSVRAIADHRSYDLKKGDIFITFPHQVHYYLNDELGQYALLIMSPKCFLGLENLINTTEPERNVVHIKPDSVVDGFFQNIAQTGGEYRDTEIAAYANLIFSQVLPELSLNPIVKTSNTTVKNILEYCSNHYNEKISLDVIAKNLHLNKYYISHIINKHIDISLNSFINCLRINAACDMLRETDKKIVDISQEVGFGAIRSFNRTFLELMKTTPKEYREKMKIKGI